VQQQEQLIRVTTPVGPQQVPASSYGGNYVYADNDVTVISGAPIMLGGYYYSGYCPVRTGPYVYPSVYCTYDGFPQYIYNPGAVILSEPYFPIYNTPYLPFYTPPYQVTYNQTNYYVDNEQRAQEIEEGGEPARTAIKHAYAEGSYQAAFADVEKAWTDGDVGLIRKHLRDNDTKISVLIKSKYAYSISSDDFAQITRDALDRLDTVSFKFSRLRKARNGDVTAYGVHVYRSTTSDNGDGSSSSSQDTVPFSSDGSSSDTSNYDQSGSSASGTEKQRYVSYTLRKHDDAWYIVMVDSSSSKLVPSQDEDPQQ